LARGEFDSGRGEPGASYGDLLLVLASQPEQQAAFDVFIAGQYDPASSDYHAWLTPEEVGEKIRPRTIRIVRLMPFQLAAQPWFAIDAVD